MWNFPLRASYRLMSSDLESEVLPLQIVRGMWRKYTKSLCVQKALTLGTTEQQRGDRHWSLAECGSFARRVCKMFLIGPLKIMAKTDRQKKPSASSLLHQHRHVNSNVEFLLKRPRPRLHVSTLESWLLLKNPIVMPQRSLYCLYVSVCYPEATGIVCA